MAAAAPLMLEDELNPLRKQLAIPGAVPGAVAKADDSMCGLSEVGVT